MCLIAAKFLYNLPIHGSLAIILFASVIYLFVSLGIDPVISSVTKSQFLVAQVSLIVSFMLALMLTGFILYFNWSIIAKNCAGLIAYAIFFVVLALKVTRTRGSK